MDKIRTLMSDCRFRRKIGIIDIAEQDRVFCRHGYDHLLDVARIMYILSLEEGLGIDKEIIYITALLHDIGRFSELEKDMSHATAGAIIARELLGELMSGYDDDDYIDQETIDMICDAISKHSEYDENASTLAKLLYRADKLSRKCFKCESYDICDWPEEQKNDVITI